MPCLASSTSLLRVALPLLLLLVNYPLHLALTGIATPASHQHSQLFLDTASVAEWRECLPLGVFHGITTNPVLLQRASVPCNVLCLKDLAHTALNTLRVKCFMLQSWGTERDELIRNALALQDISTDVVVKLPLTRNGIEAAAVLAKMSVRLCMTACYSAHQFATSTALEAEYCAPYLGRMCDAGKDGVAEITQMQRMAEGLRSHTRVFAASIRDASQLSLLSAAGVHTFTFSPAIARALYSDPLTIAAAEDFEQAAAGLSE